MSWGSPTSGSSNFSDVSACLALLESHALDVYQTLRRAPQSEYTALGGLRLIGASMTP